MRSAQVNTPTLRRRHHAKTLTANIGVMDKDMVNIIVHGHDPSLSEMIVFYANDPEMIALAKKKE